MPVELPEMEYEEQEHILIQCNGCESMVFDGSEAQSDGGPVDQCKLCDGYRI